MSQSRRPPILWTALLLLLAGPPAHGAPGEDAPSPETAAANGEAPTEGWVAQALNAVGDTGLLEGTRIVSLEAIRAAYEARDHAPIWFSERGASDAAQSLVEVLSDIEAEGLSPSRYHRQSLEVAVDSYPEGPALGRVDVLMTDAFLTLARDLGQGRVLPSDISFFMGIVPEAVDVEALLATLIEEDADPADLLDALRPQHPTYDRLIAARAKLDALTSHPWTPIPEGPEVALGQVDDRLPLISERLLALDGIVHAPGPLQCRISRSAAASQRAYCASRKGPTTMSETLTIALLQFQGHRGLEATGLVNDATIAALNRTPEALRAEIDANLERWRWLPADLGGRYVWVNIPTFTLMLHEEGEADLSMPVIVGRPDRPTPELTSTLTSVQLNPTWTVTPNLASYDILPRIKRDPNYLANKGMLLYDGWGADAHLVDPSTIDWASMTGRKIRGYRIVQRPGSDNALGSLKLRFPNDYSVYLHDTDHRALFAKEVRTLSSGCIRLGDPMALTARVLKDNGYSRDDLGSMLGRSEPINISIKSRPDIYITYFTADVDANGDLTLLPDYYGRDEGLAAALDALRTPEDGVVAR